MLNLEDFMNIRDLKQQGWSVSAIAGELNLDRKTVRKHLLEAPLDRSLPPLPARTMGKRRPQRPQTAGRDSPPLI